MINRLRQRFRLMMNRGHCHIGRMRHREESLVLMSQPDIRQSVRLFAHLTTTILEFLTMMYLPDGQKTICGRHLPLSSPFGSRATTLSRRANRQLLAHSMNLKMRLALPRVSRVGS